MKFQSRDKKLAAFTLIELIVGMVVSLIVGSAALLAYMLLFKQFEQYRTDSSKLEEIYELGTLLREDIYWSETMVKEGDALVLSFPSHQFHYIFNDHNILRLTPWRKDTFDLKLVRYKMQFDEQEIYENQTVDFLSLEFQNNNIELNATYTKEYTADLLMQLEKK